MLLCCRFYSSMFWVKVHNNSSYVITEIFFTLQCQIQSVQVKLENVRSMFENRQSCFKKLLDKHVRPVQLVAPRPENPPRSKSPLFSPKHGKISPSLWYFQIVILLSARRSNPTWWANQPLLWQIQSFAIINVWDHLLSFKCLCSAFNFCVRKEMWNPNIEWMG